MSVSASLLVNVRVMKGRRWFLNDATLLMNAIHIITYYKFVVVDLEKLYVLFVTRRQLFPVKVIYYKNFAIFSSDIIYHGHSFAAVEQPGILCQTGWTRS